MPVGGLPVAASGSAVSRVRVARRPELTPQARRLIGELQVARRRLAEQACRIDQAHGRAAGDSREFDRRQKAVWRLWDALAALGFSSAHVAHYIRKENIR